MLVITYTEYYYSSDYSVQLATTQALLGKIQTSIMNNSTHLNPHLKHINILLNQVVLTIKAAESECESRQVDTFSVEENIHPAQKIELQPRFHSTTKKTGRKRKMTVFR